MSTDLWDRVDALIDSSPGLVDLRAHGLHLLAARRWRILGRPIPSDLLAEEFQAIVRTSAVAKVLESVRAACDGPIVVMKGPIVAARFPAPSRRPLVDIDLLVPDAPTTQSALVGAGFVPTGEAATYAGLGHHLRPLRLPDSPIHIELHRYPKWPDGLEPPTVEALFAGARPADLGVDGVLTLSPSHHVLVLAAHLWAHDPLTRLSRILDVAVMAEGVDRALIQSDARRWGMARLWKTTSEISDALFYGRAKESLPLRVSGRGLKTVREATMVELQIGRFLNPFYVYRPRTALRAALSSAADLFSRKEGESWRRKAARTSRQLTSPSMRHSEHVRSIVDRRDPDHHE